MRNGNKYNMAKKQAFTVFDKAYFDWISELSQRYRQSQIKASIRINSEMLKFYWSVGKDIVERQFDNKYGSHFYENLSRDLSTALNNKRGMAPTSLRYAKYFYTLYSPLFENHRHDAEDLVKPIPIYRQVAEDFELLFCIPWTHHQKIIDKVKGNSQKAIFFVRKTWENQWGRGLLMNFLDTDLFERQGAAQTNFQTTLPAVESDLAQQLLKDPYHFYFAQLKNGKDKYIDLLFYIIPLHRYCVIEVKATEFDFQDIGQLAGYTAMVDDLLNTEQDNPSIGLLICKEKNVVLAHYALSRVNVPIGISEYEIERQQLPEELQGSLPSVEEIENGLNK